MLILDFTLEVDVRTGILSLVRALDREITSRFTVIIAATDQGPGNNQALVCTASLVAGSSKIVLELPNMMHMCLQIVSHTTH